MIYYIQQNLTKEVVMGQITEGEDFSNSLSERRRRRRLEESEKKLKKKIKKTKMKKFKSKKKR
jgi:hypothetical protein